MRVFLAHEQALLTGAAYRVHTQLWVEDPDGTFRDVTALGGKDWLVGFEYSAAADQPVGSIRAELWREDVAESLAPLMGGSSLNRDAAGSYKRFLNAGREFFIRNALTTVSSAPAAGDWWEVVRGQIDDVPHGGRQSRIALTGRDLGGILLDTKTQTKEEYGTDGQTMEAGIQAVLNRWFPSVTLYTPVATGKTIPKIKIEKDRSLLEAIREIAHGIAWDVRYQWDQGTQSFRLTLYKPARDKSIADGFPITPGLYKDVRDLTITRRLVRNDFSIEFLNAATGKREVRTRVNQPSIDEYGRLWMGFEEADDSPIDTPAEADDLLAAADNDVSEPLADQEIEMLYFPHIQLGDLLRFEPNGVHYDSAQQWAVVGYRHRLYPKERRTWIQTRGKPVGMVREWLRRALAPATDESTYTLNNFRDTVREGRTIQFDWENGPRVAEIWLTRHGVRGTVSADPWAPSSVVPEFLGLATSYTVERPPQGALTYLQFEPRDAQHQPGRVIRAILFPAPAEAPVVLIERAETDLTGTLRIRIQERGVRVMRVEARVQIGEGEPSAWLPPTRSEAGTSAIDQRGLGPGEYEHDVSLALSRISSIGFRLWLETGESLLVGPVAFDRDRTPTVVSVVVKDGAVIVTGDSDTYSIRLERADGGGSWSETRDGFTATFTPPAGDLETWVLRATAYSAPAAEIVVDTLTDTREITFRGHIAENGQQTEIAESGGVWGISVSDPPLSLPAWETFTLASPAAGTDELFITLQATSAPAGSAAHVFAREDRGEWVEITALLSPALSAPPTAATTYSYATGCIRAFERTEITTFDIRAEIRDAVGLVVDTETQTASWYCSGGGML